MKLTFAFLCCLLANPEVVETKLEQVHPVPKLKPIMERSPGQTRAIVLIHGLNIVASKTKVHQALFHDWQLPKGHLVQALSKNADVFAFAYAQNAPLTTISQLPALADGVQRLKFLGYDEIILVGHSAGGVLARMFVEDNPQAGVTRVLQVDAPNLGSSWIKIDIVAKKDQDPFLQSLSKDERMKCCLRRQDKKIPANVEFLCIVGASNSLGDGLVSFASQWPEDLQFQGIPAIRINANHYMMVRSQKTAERIAELARQSQPRWTDEERLTRKKLVLGN